MADLLEKLEAHFQGEYEISRSEIQYGKRLSIRHMEQVVHVDVFQTGTTNVTGKDSALRQEVERLLEGFRTDPYFFEKLVGAAEAEPLTPEKAIGRHISKELFGFLPEHDQRALIAAFQVLLSGLNLDDFSPAIMPVGRVYEGFLGELVVRLGICTRTTLQNPTYNFMYSFDSKDAKVLMEKVPTHKVMLESAKQRLKEFRHIQLHSQSSVFVECRTREDAQKFIERVLNDMQALFNYFKKYFVS